jgi:hypothetical protein
MYLFGYFPSFFFYRIQSASRRGVWFDVIAIIVVKIDVQASLFDLD